MQHEARIALVSPDVVTDDLGRHRFVFFRFESYRFES